jgi:hypothetical protein
MEGFMFAKHPKIAKRWAAHTKDFSKLPEHVGDEDKKKEAAIDFLALLALETAKEAGSRWRSPEGQEALQRANQITSTAPAHAWIEEARQAPPHSFARDSRSIRQRFRGETLQNQQATMAHRRGPGSTLPSGQAAPPSIRSLLPMGAPLGAPPRSLSDLATHGPVPTGMRGETTLSNMTPVGGRGSFLGRAKLPLALLGGGLLAGGTALASRAARPLVPPQAAPGAAEGPQAASAGAGAVGQAAAQASGAATTTPGNNLGMLRKLLMGGALGAAGLGLVRLLQGRRKKRQDEKTAAARDYSVKLAAAKRILRRRKAASVINAYIDTVAHKLPVVKQAALRQVQHLLSQGRPLPYAIKRAYSHLNDMQRAALACRLVKAAAVKLANPFRKILGALGGARRPAQLAAGEGARRTAELAAQGAKPLAAAAPAAVPAAAAQPARRAATLVPDAAAQQRAVSEMAASQAPVIRTGTPQAAQLHMGPPPAAPGQAMRTTALGGEHAPAMRMGLTTIPEGANPVDTFRHAYQYFMGGGQMSQQNAMQRALAVARARALQMGRTPVLKPTKIAVDDAQQVGGGNDSAQTNLLAVLGALAGGLVGRHAGGLAGRGIGRNRFYSDAGHQARARAISALEGQAAAHEGLFARAIKRAMGAERMNVAQLGNEIGHVHFHLIPRFGAADPGDPRAPIWSVDRALRKPELRPTAAEILPTIQTIRRSLAHRNRRFRWGT